MFMDKVEVNVSLMNTLTCLNQHPVLMSESILFLTLKECSSVARMRVFIPEILLLEHDSDIVRPTFKSYDMFTIRTIFYVTILNLKVSLPQV